MTDTTSIKHPTPLTSGDFTAAEEPFALFGEWFAEAVKSEPNDPNAMSLATVDADGLPDVRMVLMKGYDADGFVFYSHIASQKGRELAANPKAALLFHWKSLRRQVRIRGNVSPVTEPKPTPISRPGRSRRRSAPGPASSRSRWKAALPSSRRSRWSPPNTSSARCRARRAGAAGASRRRGSNSGTTARSACTTASNSAATAGQPVKPSPGPRRCGSIPDAVREPAQDHPMPNFIRQRAAAHAAPDRSQPRHRPCHRDPLFLGRLARHHLFAASVSRKNCPWGAGPEDHVQVDLADHADTTRAISEIRERLEGGELHALVNNAAISPKAPGGARLGTIDTDIDTWSHVFRVNFFAPIMMARGLIEELKAAKGSVVNVTSIAGSRVHPFAGAAYATSKAALASLTREMASDFGRVGVRVNSIAPGEIDTSILSPGTEKIVDQQIPLHRLGTPDEVAKIIYVLCTETSSYVNGAEIHINGGQHV